MTATVTEPASFVPRSLLEHPDDFGAETDVTWRLAASLDEAIRLARALDQHHLSIAVGRMLRRSGHSMADLATVLGERPETLAGKPRGRRPAPEGDLCMWSWMSGARRTHPPLGELVAVDGDPSGLLPTLGEPARLRR